MRHLDLFSGIGGFALAARWLGWETVQFCEIDPWCRRVLAKNFPGVPIHDDIKTLDGASIDADVLTGGFPCQPYSRAGRQRGASDDRALWPEMRRVIAECRPRWVLGENTDGIIRLELDGVLADLEDLGYTCWPLAVPAVAVEAPHVRNRIWVVAHTDRQREPARSRHLGPSCRELGEAPADRHHGQRDESPAPLQAGRHTAERRHWRSTEPPIPRMDDGLSPGVDAVRGLGNAIVPQVAYELMRLMT